MMWVWMAVLIVVNGAFSLTEMSLAASKWNRLENIEGTGAADAVALARDPNRFLAATQIGLTGTNLLLGMVAQAWLAARLDDGLAAAGWTQALLWRHGVSLVLVTVGLTAVAIIVGEMLPKRLALTHPETIACRMAPWMMRFIWLASPLIAVLSRSTDGLLRWIGAPVEPLLNAHALLDDLRASIEAGADAGVLDRTEQRLFDNVLHLDEVMVGSIMTPRSDLVWLNSRASSDQWLDTLRQHPQAQYLVAQDDLDHVIGVVLMTELWPAVLAHQPLDAASLSLAPVLAVPERMDALTLLKFFQAQRTHQAIVVNEYGVLQGLVTLNDWLIMLAGNVPSSMADDSLMIQRHDGSWWFDGVVPIEDVRRALVFEVWPEETPAYHTLAGLIIERLGRIPRKGDFFDWHGWRFEVADMERHRVDEVLVMPLTSTPSSKMDA